MSILPVAPLAVGAAAGLASHAADKLSQAAATFADLLRADEGRQTETQPATGAMAPGLDGHAIHPDQIRGDTEQALRQFQQLLQSRLVEAGAITSLRFELQSDEAGGVHVVGDHPYKEQIDHVLASDPELAEMFHYLDANFSLLRAVERHQPLSQYAYDPIPAAVALSDEVGRDKDAFTVAINGDQVEVAFK